MAHTIDMTDFFIEKLKNPDEAVKLLEESLEEKNKKEILMTLHFIAVANGITINGTGEYVDNDDVKHIWPLVLD